MILPAQNTENAVQLSFSTHKNCAPKQSIAQCLLNFVRFKITMHSACAFIYQFAQKMRIIVPLREIKTV